MKPAQAAQAQVTTDLWEQLIRRLASHLQAQNITLQGDLDILFIQRVAAGVLAEMCRVGPLGVRLLRKLQRLGSDFEADTKMCDVAIKVG